MIMTVQGHISQARPEASAELGWLLSGITLATKMIEAKIRSAGLTDIYGSFGAENVQGEQAAEAGRLRQPGAAALPGHA